MATFSRQSQLPSLPVPNLNKTLDKYLISAKALLSPQQLASVTESVEKFRNSENAKRLQTALENRAKDKQNWLEDWWYDAYNEVREPLAPFLSFGALNSTYKRLEGGQLSRAADLLYGWATVWQRIRSEKWPITSSRGVVWDMSQFHNLFSSNRTPYYRKDVIDRYFNTRAEGASPRHAIICCRGTIWKVNIADEDDNLKTPDQLYAVLKFIKENSKENENCITKLTTCSRDEWAKNREELLRIDRKNAAVLREIEESIMFLTLADKVLTDEDQPLRDSLMGESSYVWQDKSVSVVVYEDAVVGTQGDHSNIDAIVLLQAGDDVASKVRKELWAPNEKVDFELPCRLDFILNPAVISALAIAHNTFYKTKASFRAKAVHFTGYGNDRCRANKIYTDTVIQIALQLAFTRTHGLIVPIYETASTRKFWHGRTETVRGCTPEFVAFARAFVDGKTTSEDRSKLFSSAMAAHNQLMADCMDGKGFDRHLFGLKKTQEMFSKGCSPKFALPSFLCDDTWRATGGDGNFLLSTSFIGYMIGDEPGTYGFVCAMRHDGYGCFYRIGKNRITVAISDWAGTRSNIDAFGENVKWALDQLGHFIPLKQSKI